MTGRTYQGNSGRGGRGSGRGSGRFNRYGGRGSSGHNNGNRNGNGNGSNTSTKVMLFAPHSVGKPQRVHMML